MRLSRRQVAVLIVGLALICVGVAAAYLQLSGSHGLSRWLPLVCGVGMLVAAIVTGHAALFAAAGPLTGVGVAAALLLSSSNASAATPGFRDAAILLFAFAGGWLAVPPLSWLFADRTPLWPLVPGLAASGIGLILIVSGGTERAAGAIGGVLLASVAALLVVWLRSRSKR